MAMIFYDGFDHFSLEELEKMKTEMKAEMDEEVRLGRAFRLNIGDHSILAGPGIYTIGFDEDGNPDVECCDEHGRRKIL